MLHQAADEDETLADGIAHDYTQLDLTPRLEAILNYATLLTRDPSAVQPEDVEILRRGGLSDEEILSVVLITCVFNFMTRLADGLGVALDDSLEKYADRFLRPAEADDADWLRRGKASPMRAEG